MAGSLPLMSYVRLPESVRAYLPTWPSGSVSEAGARQLDGRSPTRLDLRLALVSIAAWIGTQLGLLCGARWPVATVWLGGTLSVLLSAGLLFTRLDHARRFILTCLLAVGIGGCSAALRLLPLVSGPLAALAADGAAISAQVELTGDPVRKVAKVVGDRRGPELVEATANITAFTARGKRWALRVPVLLRGDSQLIAYGPGTRLSVEGVLRPPGYRIGVAAIVSLRTAPNMLGRAPPVWSATTDMRHRLVADCAGLSPDVRGLLPGLAVGDTSGAPTQLLADMKVTGLTHLVAVSGTNTALILAALLALTARLRRSTRVVVALIGLAGFVVLVRPQPSVSRAAVMGLVAVSALVLGGRRSALPALGGAVLFLVVVDPWLAISYGFALSVCATAGLVLLAPHLGDALRSRLPRLPALLVDAVGVSLAAQIATIPLIVALAGYVSPTSLPANLLAAPAVGPATVFGVLAALAGQGFPGLAQVFVHLAAVPTWWIARVAHWFAGISTLGMPKGLGGGLLALFGLGLVVVLVRSRIRHKALLVAGLACLVLLSRCGASAGPADWPPSGWIFVACDVGQGDALVLRDGPESAIVVDTGPDPRAVDGCLSRLRVTSISLLMLTHFHADHVAGLSGVLHRRAIAAVVVSPYPDPPPEQAAAQAELRGRGLTARELATGDRIKTGTWELTVLWPPGPSTSDASLARAGGPNDEALVVSAAMVGTPLRILLGADIGPGPQARIEAAPGIAYSVVKVPHHGSTYQAAGFARWAGAPLAVVSVGAGNPYGHPVATTLARYRAAGAAVLRTDESGDVAVLLIAGRLGYRLSR